MVKLIASLIVLSCAFAVALGDNSIALQLVNALISHSNTGSSGLTAPGAYGNLGFSAPQSCSASPVSSSYPSGASLPFLTLKVCYGSTSTYPFRNASSGYEYDLVASWNALLTATYNSSVTVQWVESTVTGNAGIFAVLMNDVTAGNCHVLLNTIYESDARDASYSVSCPYATVYGGLIYNPTLINATTFSFNNLNSANVTIAVGNGTSSLTFVQAHLPNANLVLTGSTAESFSRVANGAAQVAFGEGPNAAFYAQSNPTACNGTACVAVDGSLFGFGPYKVVSYTTQIAGSTTTTTSTTTTGATTSTSSASSVFASVALVVAAFVLAMF